MHDYRGPRRPPVGGTARAGHKEHDETLPGAAPSEAFAPDRVDVRRKPACRLDEPIEGATKQALAEKGPPWPGALDLGNDLGVCPMTHPPPREAPHRRPVMPGHAPHVVTHEPEKKLEAVELAVDVGTRHEIVEPWPHDREEMVALGSTMPFEA